MDFRKELAKWGYNSGNSVDVSILIDEILPDMFSTMYSKDEVYRIVEKAIKESKEKQLTFFNGGSTNPLYYNLKMWFEQFKKK